MSKEKTAYFITGYNIKTNSNRCWVYLFSEEEARDYVTKDSEMIWEDEFDHCVIEEIPPGWIVNTNKKEIWFKYDKENSIYKEVEKPEELKELINFAIG